MTMEEPSPIFTLPFGDAESDELRSKSTEYVEVFHQASGGLLENDATIQQFLSSNELLEKPDLNGPTTLHCEICKKKFDNAKKYYGHLRIHSNKSTEWVCDKCPDAKFTTKQQLMKHSLKHKPLERIWKCPQCPMVFEVLFRLQQHLFAKHLNCRPHKCGLCEKAFNKLSDLKKHEAVHSLKRKFPCEICYQRFKDKSNLARHQLTHSKDKPFVCTGCGNRYAQIASLRRHTKNCQAAKEKKQPLPAPTPPRRNYCRVCGRTFLYKGQLLDHYDKAHSDKSFDSLTETPLTVATPCEYEVEENMLRVNSIEENVVEINIIEKYDAVARLEPFLTINNYKLETAINQELEKEKQDDNEKHEEVHNEFTVPEDAFMTANNEFITTNDQSNTDTVVDTIVEDILSVEDEYRIVNSKPMQNRNEIVQAITREALIKETALKKENNARLQQEFLKEMNQLNSLEDELFYSDIDFDLHPSQVFNMNTSDIAELSNQERHGEMLFDFTDGSRSMDQDIMNALYQDKADQLPDELLNVPVDENPTETEDLLRNHVSINECSTIFESDVDLEASTNLAANLNQLIGENNVRYVSTEHDDTFIISLDSGIDAEKLSDMLNIGGEIHDDIIKESNQNNNEVNVIDNEATAETKLDKAAADADAIVFKIPETKIVKIDKSKKSGESQNKENTEVVTTKSRKEVLYVCRFCEKVFNRRDNYWSHLALHEPALRRHACAVCARRFSYRSTLSKHVRAAHEPRAPPPHACTLCHKVYRAPWLLKDHMERDHHGATPYSCPETGCGKKFYKKSDLAVHLRFHTGERPYACDVCKQRFQHSSHLIRHKRSLRCGYSAYNKKVTPRSSPRKNSPKKKTSETRANAEPLNRQKENFFNPKLVAFKPLKQPPPSIRRDKPKFDPQKDMKTMNIKIEPKMEPTQSVTITKIFTNNAATGAQRISVPVVKAVPKPLIIKVPPDHLANKAMIKKAPLSFTNSKSLVPPNKNTAGKIVPTQKQSLLKNAPTDSSKTKLSINKVHRTNTKNLSLRSRLRSNTTKSLINKNLPNQHKKINNYKLITKKLSDPVTASTNKKAELGKSLLKKLPIDPLSVKKENDLVGEQGKVKDATNNKDDEAYYFFITE